MVLTRRKIFFISFLFEICRNTEYLVPDGLKEMTLLGIDDSMSEETDEIVCHDNKRVAGFSSPEVLGRELVSREVVLDFLDSVLRVCPSAIEVIDGLCRQCQ